MRIWPLKYRPYLHLLVDLGFIQLRTSVMYMRVETDAVEYVALEVRIFGRVNAFALYNTFERTLR